MAKTGQDWPKNTHDSDGAGGAKDRPATRQVAKSTARF